MENGYHLFRPFMLTAFGFLVLLLSGVLLAADMRDIVAAGHEGRHQRLAQAGAATSSVPLLYFAKPQTDEIQYLDADANVVLGSIPIPNNLGSIQMALTPDGGSLYVVRSDFIDVSRSFFGVIDTDLNSVTGSLTLPVQSGGPSCSRQAKVTDIKTSPDGQFLYLRGFHTGCPFDSVPLACQGPTNQPDLVYVFDTSTNTLVDEICIGPDPRGSGINDGGSILLSPDGSRLYAQIGIPGPPPNYDALERVIKVFDIATKASLGTISLPGRNLSGSMTIAPDGLVLYATTSNTVDPFRPISVIDLGTNTETATIRVPFILARVGRIRLSPDGQRLYASSGGTTNKPEFVVFSTQTLLEVGRLDKPPFLTSGFFLLTPDGQTLYSMAGDIQIADTQTLTLIDEVLGAGAGSAAVYKPAPSGPPSPPSFVKATPADEQVTIDWEFDSDPTLADTEIHRSTVNDFTPSAATLIATVPIPGATYLDQGVVNETTYFYKLLLVNDVGEKSLPSWQVVARPGTAAVLDGKIAFISRRTGSLDIFFMDPDGSNQTQVTTDTPDDEEYARWSPDGEAILFAKRTDPSTNQRDIFVIDADGTNKVNLTPGSPLDDTDPAWAPDGTQIVFASTRDPAGQGGELFVMDADGSNPVRITDFPGDDREPSWSPDGNRIAFHVWDGALDLFLINPDGSNRVRLTDNTFSSAAPYWSPDGSRILFYSDRDGNREIYVMHADGSNQARLTNSPSQDVPGGWSPDGTRIVFSSERDGNFEVYVMEADGSNQTRLTNDGAVDVATSWGRAAPLPDTLTDGKDAILRSGAKHRNEGANPLLHLGQNRRLVIGYDLSGYDLSGLSSATLMLTINPDDPPAQWGSSGRPVDVHRLLEPFAEGNGKAFGLPNAEKTRGTGEGVTWNCAIDMAIENQKDDCTPKWGGGSFEATPTDAVVHTNGMSGVVSWDVTTDVTAGFARWLIKKTQGNGNVRYYAKEHPDVGGNPDLAPRLVLAFGGSPTLRLAGERDRAQVVEAALVQEVPSGYALEPNYPNPFNPSTEIRFALPAAAHVRLVVFDVAGREVAHLIDGVRPPGYHRVTFEAGALPSGVYFYQLATEAFTETRMMTLLR